MATSLAVTPAHHPVQDHREYRGARLIAIRDFSGFTRAEDPATGEVTLTSPEIDPQIAWDELVLSWNVDSPTDTGLKFEARGVYPDHTTRWYVMGLWSAPGSQLPRESVNKQRDADGNVLTDTLVLQRPGPRLQVRISVVSPPSSAVSPPDNHRPNSEVRGPQSGSGLSPLTSHLSPILKLLTLSFLDSKSLKPVLEPNRAAWGKTVDVPERSQLAYKDQQGWCSPTSLSMVLAYWGKQLNRPEMDRDVPDIANCIYDPQWKGTGNWPFNTAFAGAYPGMRAYVARFTDVSELEDWIAAGIPVICSVSYRLMHGKGQSDSHIVVCVGFTPDGDAVINDPWAHVEKGERVRCTVPRANLIAAWKVSKFTVYLVYPETVKPPPDRYGHWMDDDRERG